MKRISYWVILFVLLTSFNLGCIKRVETVYKDVPEDSIVVKRETLRNVLETVIEKDQQLKECLEREHIDQ
jgi:hypothetical protein